MGKQQLASEHFDWSKYDYHLKVPVPGEEILVSEGRTVCWAVSAKYTSFEFIVRTPKLESEPVYQLLTPGMTIREGDEFWLAPKVWVLAVSTAIGRRVGSVSVWRRKLPEGTKLGDQ